MNLTDAVREFEVHLVAHKRASVHTRMAYISDLEHFVRHCSQQGFHSLPEITQEIAREYVSSLHHADLKSSSIARKVSTIKAFYHFATERWGIPNIGTHVIIPRQEKKLPQYLTYTEIENLLQVAHEDQSFLGKRNRLMLYLLYGTGLRISELVSLEWQHIVSTDQVICIVGKRGKYRYVPLPDTIMPMIEEYQQLHKQRYQSPFLFVIRYGKKESYISRQALWGILKKLWKKTGNKKNIWPHQLRHSLATHLLERGMHVRALQQLLGHERIDTVQLYTHVETQRLRVVYKKKHPRS